MGHVLSRTHNTAQWVTKVLAAVCIPMMLTGEATGVAHADAAVPVDPGKYVNTTGNQWQFYTPTNINCLLNDDRIVCVLDPSRGPGADMNIAMVSAEGSWTTWSATQARIFGPPNHPFDASKHGRLMQPGRSITVGARQCSLSDTSVIECRNGQSGFVIDSAGIHLF